MERVFHLPIFLGILFACLDIIENVPDGVYPIKKLRDSYDYIIVGGGSTGSVLANRLSEDSKTTVLLLEAGGPPPGLSDVPLFPLLLQGVPEDYNYYTEPQKNACLGLNDKKSYWSRYKVLGGCSSHNFMIYARGSQKDFDGWEKSGASGWSWKDVLPYFLKSEGQTDPTLLANGFHNSTGLLTTSYLNYVTPLRNAYLDAATSLGYKTGADYNTGSGSGFYPLQVTQRNGLRCSTEKAFLRPVVNRPNLDVITHAMVSKVEFDGKQARRVIFEQQNKSQSVTSNKEIILSAGTIGSAQILMLSGIGPKQDLTKLGIPVIADLPVGQNLQDHVGVALMYQLNDSVGIVSSRDINPYTFGELLDEKGPLTSAATVESLGFYRTKYQVSTNEDPDVLFYITCAFFAEYMGAFTPEIQAALGKYSNVNATSGFVTLLTPKSRGFVKVRSTDINVHPIIDPQYFSDPEDLEKLIVGMKYFETLIASPDLQKYDPQRVPNVVPGCESTDPKSDDYLRCLARTLTYTVYHPVGTCKMGSTDDNTTVIDSQLRVKGVVGLRVADASIMPFSLTGSPNAACIMIGEKAADMIRNV